MTINTCVDGCPDDRTITMHDDTQFTINGESDFSEYNVAMYRVVFQLSRGILK